MSCNYSIWHDVKACHYKSNKSYGGISESKEIIYIGSSATYSEEHCRILTTKRNYQDKKYGDCHIFSTSIDGIILKQSIWSIKERKVVKIKTKLSKLKSLQ